MTDLVLWLVRTDARMWLCVVVAASLCVVAGCVAWPFTKNKEVGDAGREQKAAGENPAADR
jgi:hypothetical protein